MKHSKMTPLGKGDLTKYQLINLTDFLLKTARYNSQKYIYYKKQGNKLESHGMDPRGEGYGKLEKWEVG